MKIYLIRHGQSEWNVQNRLQGSSDSALTEKGMNDSQKLSNYIEEEKIEIDQIYTSKNWRAIETAKIIRADKKKEIITKDALREMNSGSWQGMTWEEIKERHPEEYFSYWNQPALYRADNKGEDFRAVSKRAINFIQKLIQYNKSKNILIVSHGVTLKAVLNYYQNRRINNFWDKPLLQGTALNLIKIERKEVKIKYTNKIEHLTA